MPESHGIRTRIVGSVVVGLAILMISCQTPRVAEPPVGEPAGGPASELKPVFRSEEQPPAWIEGPPPREADGIEAVGKGNSVQNVIAAHELALMDAVRKIMLSVFGKSVRVDFSVDMVPEDQRIYIKPRARIWLDEKPVEVTDFEGGGVYYEIWETEGQQVFVVWTRLRWPRSSMQSLLKEHSI